LNVASINPKKMKEDELDVEELLPLLTEEDPLGRVKVAEILQNKVKVGSYKNYSCRG
jgi:hypothetical protein